MGNDGGHGGKVQWGREYLYMEQLAKSRTQILHKCLFAGKGESKLNRLVVEMGSSWGGMGLGCASGGLHIKFCQS